MIGRHKTIGENLAQGIEEGALSGFSVGVVSSFLFLSIGYAKGAKNTHFVFTPTGSLSFIVAYISVLTTFGASLGAISKLLGVDKSRIITSLNLDEQENIKNVKSSIALSMFGAFGEKIIGCYTAASKADEGLVRMGYRNT